MTEFNEEQIRAKAEACGQGHLFSSLDSASPEDRRSFLADLAGLDWDLIGRLQGLITEADSAAAQTLEPAPSFKKGDDIARDEKARAAGEALLDAGKVAIFVVAGGQGSRLGYEGPKGQFPATPVREKSLFEVFAAKVAAVSARHGLPMPWYVMTSHANHEATLSYFEEKGYFGLAREQIMFFSQDMLPAMDLKGRFLLEAPGRLFMSPNGHGGSLLALAKSGALADMKKRGIEELFYFQVDNPLVVMADPIFLGYHSLAKAEMSTKVVSKRDAGEKVGVVGLVNGKYGVIEYSDLSAEEREAQDADGRLKFRDGNIAIHAIRRDFIETLTRGGLDLPYHLAHKNIPAMDPSTMEAASIPGIKFETFVFDALARCKNSVVLEVDRAAEFAPIKNAEGEDSPSTSRSAQIALFASWLKHCGHEIPSDGAGQPLHKIEIDPRVADSAEALHALGITQCDFSRDLVLE